MRINQVQNPSFETDATGWAATGATTGVPVRTAGSWGWGAWYGKLQASTTGVAVSATFGASVYTIPAAPDDRVSATVKVHSDNAGAEGVRCILRLKFLDGSAAVLATDASPTVFLKPDKTTIFLFSSMLAPAGTVKVVPEVLFEATDIVAGDQVGVDGLDVRINEPPDTYGDGDSVTFDWEGTPHASRSIEVIGTVAANPKNWKTGAVRIQGLLYRCDENGTRLDDLSRSIVSGRVAWNADKGPGQKLSGDFVLDKRGLLRVYEDFVAPVLRIEWRDGTVEEKQFGLYLCDFPNDKVWQKYAQQGVKGLDPTWFPYNSAVRDTINYASSDKVVSKMAELLSVAWPRVNFPPSSRAFGEAKSIYPGIRRYDAAADQLKAMNWYVPFSDLVGVIRTMPYIDMARLTPAVRIDYEDFVGEWSVVPTTTTLANVVSVYKENTAGAGAPIASVAVNSDPSSRISTAYRPEILREITNANLQTQAEADALTLSLLQESASYYRVISGKLSPGTWMEPYCAADVYLSHVDWGNLSGRYYVREWIVNFTQADAEVQVEMNRTVEYGSDEDQ